MSDYIKNLEEHIEVLEKKLGMLSTFMQLKVIKSKSITLHSEITPVIFFKVTMSFPVCIDDDLDKRQEIDVLTAKKGLINEKQGWRVTSYKRKDRTDKEAYIEGYEKDDEIIDKLLDIMGLKGYKEYEYVDNSAKSGSHELIVTDLVSVQPMMQPIGNTFAMTYSYSTPRNVNCISGTYYSVGTI